MNFVSGTYEALLSRYYPANHADDENRVKRLKKLLDYELPPRSDLRDQETCISRDRRRKLKMYKSMYKRNFK